MDKPIKDVINNSYKKEVDYYIPKDLGYTLGTVYKNLQTWVEKELKGIVKFNHLYIDTKVNYAKDFLWNKGLLGQARKPTLALQFSMELNENSDPWNVPAFKNIDSIKYLNHKDFTNRMFMFEDNDDIRNTLEVRFGMKNIKCTLNAGIATVTRMENVNIANYWNSRRSNGYAYNLEMTNDFKIPPIIIYIICKKFKVNFKNHHDVLKFLNMNSAFPVFYGLDGNNGRFYYFIRYKCDFIIKPDTSTNPQGWEIQGTMQSNTWTFNRTFDLDIQVPYIISLNHYGDKYRFEEFEELTQYELVKDEYSNANITYNERILEIERVITNKHAIKQINFNFEEKDLISITDKVKMTEKIDLKDLWKDDVYLTKLVKWALSKKYTYLDLFNFKLHKVNKRFYNKPELDGVSIDEIDFLSGDVDFSILGEEYEGYIKNMKDMYFVDINPDIKAYYVGILYLNLDIDLQYRRESGEYYNEETSNDDFGMTQGLQDGKEIRLHNDVTDNKRDFY